MVLIKTNTKTLGALITASIFLSLIAMSSNIGATTYTGANITNASTTINLTISKFVAITPSANISDGITFGTINATSQNVSATNNFNFEGGLDNCTSYNFTVDSSSSANIDFYDKINETMTGLTMMEMSSQSGNNITFSGNTTITDSWTVMGVTGAGNVNCTDVSNSGTGNCWQYYFANVTTVATVGYKEKKFEFCAEYTGAGLCSNL